MRRLSSCTRTERRAEVTRPCGAPGYAQSNLDPRAATGLSGVLAWACSVERSSRRDKACDIRSASPRGENETLIRGRRGSPGTEETRDGPLESRRRPPMIYKGPAECRPDRERRGSPCHGRAAPLGASGRDFRRASPLVPLMPCGKDPGTPPRAPHRSPRSSREIDRRSHAR